MQATDQKRWDKYTRLEWAFFFFVWFLIPLISDLEYELKEPPSPYSDPWKVALLRRFVWGCFSVIPFYVFYKTAVQRWLVRRRYLRFGMALLVFIPLLELYTVYVQDGMIAQMRFLPEKLYKDAEKWGNSKHLLHFTISYLILQMLEITALAFFIDHEKQTQQVQALQQARTEADMQYLKAQLQPHFFFNTLNNIYALALQRSELTAPLTAKLSGMMRYVLYEDGRKTSSLQQEVDFIRDYIDVQAIRYRQALNISMETQGTESPLQIEPLLLFPFIENAFKHGIEEETGSGFVEVLIVVTGNELTFSVKNSIAQKQEGSKKGIGIENTRKRLALLYPNNYELSIRQEENTYSVLLTLMLS